VTPPYDRFVDIPFVDSNDVCAPSVGCDVCCLIVVVMLLLFVDIML
jgi:hypothetical protein